MKTLFVLAGVMVVLFLAAPATKIPVRANTIAAQTPESVSRLEARVAELEKRLTAVEAQLARIAANTSGAAQSQPGQVSGTSRDNGTRFIGYWKGVRSGDYMLISKDGDKYIIREPSAGVFPCELINGSLKSGTLIGNVDFIESSGHITWRGIEWQKLPQTSR
jgi:hypothetical protein